MIDDAALLRRYTEERSEAAFAELVHRYLNLVYSAALRRLGGDAHGAADVAQKVFISLARHANALTRHTVLTAWLYATTRHAALDTLRAERRRRAREQEAHIMNELLSSPASEANWTRLRPVLDEVMDQLGERDREAVLLRFFEDRPLAEIGAVLGVSDDAARMRVDRALDKLHSLLAQRGVTSTAAALGLVLANQAVVAAPATMATTIVGAALSGVATAGSATAAGWIGFMGTTKFISGGAVIVMLLALAAGVYEMRSTRFTYTALLADRRDIHALALRVGDAERRSKEASHRQMEEPHQVANMSGVDTTIAPEAEVNGPFGPEPQGSRTGDGR